MPPVTVYFDLETAGLEPQHPTIQLAAVAIGPLGQELGAFEQKIAFNPTDADPEALALNGYTAKAWKDAVVPGVAASRFAAWLRPYCTVDRVSKAGNPYAVARGAGYNVTTFDGPRLRALFGAAFCPVDYLLLDVLAARALVLSRRGRGAGEFQALDRRRVAWAVDRRRARCAGGCAHGGGGGRGVVGADGGVVMADHARSTLRPVAELDDATAIRVTEAVRDYMEQFMAMDNVYQDQEQNWTFGHMVTCAQLIALAVQQRQRNVK